MPRAATYILMADADLTYDFNEIPRFLAALEAGADMVIGDRMQNIQPGAMPWHHRYIGNPLLSRLLNLFFHTGVNDAHCGMRAFRREHLERLDLRTSGMEFASEMVVRAAKADLEIDQLPIEYRPRGGESKLSSFRDGWRHLRYLMMHSPTHLFIFPGTAMATLGGLICAMVLAHVDLFGRRWEVHTLIGGSLLLIVGTQVVTLGLCARTYGICFMGERDPWFERMWARYRLEHGLLLGSAIAAVGLAILAGIVLEWVQARLWQPLRGAPRDPRGDAAGARHPGDLRLVPAQHHRAAAPLMRIRAALGVGLVLIVVAFVVTLAHTPLTVARSGVATEHTLVSTGKPAAACQGGETLPRGTTALRVSLTSALGPRVAVRVLSGSHVIARGTTQPGWSDASVTVPVRRAVTHGGAREGVLRDDAHEWESRDAGNANRQRAGGEVHGRPPARPDGHRISAPGRQLVVVAGHHGCTAPRPRPRGQRHVERAACDHARRVVHHALLVAGREGAAMTIVTSARASGRGALPASAGTEGPRHENPKEGGP